MKNWRTARVWKANTNESPTEHGTVYNPVWCEDDHTFWKRIRAASYTVYHAWNVSQEKKRISPLSYLVCQRTVASRIANKFRDYQNNQREEILDFATDIFQALQRGSLLFRLKHRSRTFRTQRGQWETVFPLVRIFTKCVWQGLLFRLSKQQADGKNVARLWTLPLTFGTRCATIWIHSDAWRCIILAINHAEAAINRTRWSPKNPPGNNFHALDSALHRGLSRNNRHARVGAVWRAVFHADFPSRE